MKINKNTAFRELSRPQKLRYIWDYYKLPIAIAAILIYILCWQLYRQATKKEVLLYTAAVNITMGDELTADLTEHYLQAISDTDPRQTISLLGDLVLTGTEDAQLQQFTNASRLKLMGAIEARQLDVIFMNKEAYDAFSQSGYLLDLASISEDMAASVPEAGSHLVQNTVILEDNASDVIWDKSIPYEATTLEETNAVDLSDAPLLKAAGLDGTVYLGIVANTPRLDEALSYLRYLYSSG